MSRRDRPPPSGSLSSREKSRDDYYRNPDDRERDRDRWRKRERSRSGDRHARRSRSRENRNRSERKPDNTDRTDTRVREMSISPTHDEDDEDRIPTPPPPPRISKISIGFNKPAPKPLPIKMTLGVQPNPSTALTLKPKVASVFNEGSDEEPEEMPAEARMRMRNIGRETPTSAGPNSFGKTKHGFCDAKNIFQRNLREAMDKVAPPPNPSSKYPSTIYKLQQ
ncbi:uncharacterized protein LOC143910019 [Arctopsyche grandis]|uniref:uncharacterized protein LOC143910019 n=1 Tax=Arctopsyche grandis TaxID=121162 RepID=UPI00406D6798